MNRPEYWQDDETLAAYEEWEAKSPIHQEPPKDRLELAIEAARGGPAPIQRRGYA